MVDRTISHYRIECELGKGGMGIVYRAHDDRLRRNVALKILPSEIASRAERRARVLAEARAAASLNHPGITTIYEVGEEDGQVFIVMELVSGKTLRALSSDGPMEPKALARVGAEVAEALAAAHAQGVVHGDIKPENIIVQPDGRVKLLDFGIARQRAAETLTVTRSLSAHPWLPDSQIAGTLAYMAPETLRGELTDARADLFSLGVVLYELTARRRPFPGPTTTALTTPRSGFNHAGNSATIVSAAARCVTHGPRWMRPSRRRPRASRRRGATWSGHASCAPTRSRRRNRWRT